MVAVVAEFRHIRIKILTFIRYFLTAKGKMARAIFSQDISSLSSLNSLTVITSVSRRL